MNIRLHFGINTFVGKDISWGFLPWKMWYTLREAISVDGSPSTWPDPPTSFPDRYVELPRVGRWGRRDNADAELYTLLYKDYS